MSRNIEELCLIVAEFGYTCAKTGMTLDETKRRAKELHRDAEKKMRCLK